MEGLQLPQKIEKTLALPVESFSVLDGDVHGSLIIGKVHVKLSAAVVGARISTEFRNELDIDSVPEYF